MPPATRLRAAAQPFASPSTDFTPMSSVDVEAMLLAAEQSTDSAPTLRRSTRRATLLANAAGGLTQHDKVATSQSPSMLPQRSTAKPAAGAARRSTAVAASLPPKSGAASRPRPAGAAAVHSTKRSQPAADKENVGPAQPRYASEQPFVVDAAAKLTGEARRSSRLSLIPVMNSASGPISVGRTRQTWKPSQATEPFVTLEQVIQPQSVTAEAKAEPIAVVSPVKALPRLPVCKAASHLSPMRVPPPPPPTATSSPVTGTAAEQSNLTTTSSLSTARHLRLQPIRAIQLLSPTRPAPMSARARTQQRAPSVLRRRSASAKRESLLGEGVGLVWQARTPPREEVRAIVRREEEKRRRRVERLKEVEREKEAVRQTAVEAGSERQRMVAQQESAVVEASKELNVSLLVEQPTPALLASILPSQQCVPPPQPQSVSAVPVEEASMSDEQRLLVAEAEVEEMARLDVSEQAPSGCPIRTMLSAGVSTAMVAAICAVLFYPLEVNSWLS